MVHVKELEQSPERTGACPAQCQPKAGVSLHYVGNQLRRAAERRQSRARQLMSKACFGQSDGMQSK